MYSIPKESKYEAKFLSVDNETQCVPLLLSLIFIRYTPSFILGKLFLEKNTSKSKLVIEILSILDIA